MQSSKEAPAVACRFIKRFLRGKLRLLKRHYRTDR
jgi:hypothetical protein